MGELAVGQTAASLQKAGDQLAPIISDEPQIDENRIGGGALRFVADPLLNRRQPVGRLMDIVAVGDVAERSQKLFETFQPGAEELP